MITGAVVIIIEVMIIVAVGLVIMEDMIITEIEAVINHYNYSIEKGKRLGFPFLLLHIYGTTYNKISFSKSYLIR